MKRLPYFEKCIVEERKITGYLLSDTHFRGRAKSKYFTSFGFGPIKWPEFAAALRAHAAENDWVSFTPSLNGQIYEVVCTIRSPDGRNPCIRSFWELVDEVPRLVTAYPK